MNTLFSFLHFFTPHHSNNQRPKLLHPSSVLAIIGFVLVFQIALRQTNRYFPQILGYASNIPVAEIITLSNAERAKRNLPPLNIDENLNQAAAQKAADMFAKDYWAHVSPDGTQPWSFFTAVGYSYRYAGENLARDFTSSRSVVDAWMSSPKHRDNLLSSRYQDVGVAVVDGQLGGRDTTLVVQLFGTRVSAPPPKASKTSRSRAIIPQVRAISTVEDSTTSQPVSSAPAPQSAPVISQFDVNKNIAIILLGVFLLTIVIDLAVVYRKSLVRWTSKSLAHLIFIFSVILSLFAVLSGQIA